MDRFAHADEFLIGRVTADDESDSRLWLTLLRWHRRRGCSRLIFVRDQLSERASDVSN
jgi:hypothetical protein